VRHRPLPLKRQGRHVFSQSVVENGMVKRLSEHVLITLSLCRFTVSTTCSFTLSVFPNMFTHPFCTIPTMVRNAVSSTTYQDAIMASKGIRRLYSHALSRSGVLALVPWSFHTLRIFPNRLIYLSSYCNHVPLVMLAMKCCTVMAGRSLCRVQS
jgi:hypothetical protein